MAEQYTPSEAEVAEAWWEGRKRSEPDHVFEPAEVYLEEFDRFLARVRRDAALHEKQRIAGEVRFWASINHGGANEDMGDLLDLVAGDIDRIPEETP